MKACFVTGTDTEVGKTSFCRLLLEQLGHHGLHTAAFKPVASGCTSKGGVLVSEDAQALMQAMTCDLPYGKVNPYAFEPAISPHIAAKEAGVQVTMSDLVMAYMKLATLDVDYLVVEGAGGWYVPINEQETVADFAKAIDVPVVLVVAMRLGCINHTLLSYHALQQMGVRVAGWVANEWVPLMERVEENIATLSSKLSVPLLGRMVQREQLVLEMSAAGRQLWLNEALSLSS